MNLGEPLISETKVRGGDPSESSNLERRVATGAPLSRKWNLFITADKQFYFAQPEGFCLRVGFGFGSVVGFGFVF